MTNATEPKPTVGFYWAPGLLVTPLVTRLRRYNEWRRGAECEQPDPVQIGTDIDEAADLLEKWSSAILDTLQNNLHLADGDNCTLIDLVRVARKASRQGEAI